MFTRPAARQALKCSAISPKFALCPFTSDKAVSLKSCFLYMLASAVLAGPVAAADSETRWHVVLAAVGNEQNVFDNFVNDFGARLKDSPSIASFTELHASTGGDWHPSGMRDLERALTALKPGEGEGCLIYLTGHGAPEGLAMSADVPMLYVRPTRMESMLSGCAQRPTVLIVSACFSGIYARPGLTKPERVIMTASAADLTSFGCSNNNRYTFFDQCFIDAWPRNREWGALGDEIERCVRNTERSGGFPSSNPQFFFGAGLREMDLPAAG